jgi:hypothetical protein
MAGSKQIKLMALEHRDLEPLWKEIGAFDNDSNDGVLPLLRLGL